jgi:hypothetical protein
LSFPRRAASVVPWEVDPSKSIGNLDTDRVTGCSLDGKGVAEPYLKLLFSVIYAS